GARKGSINAGIKTTLSTPDDRRNFWAYNNGITFLCDSFALKGKERSSISLTNFSIVNGCQTTVSIAEGSNAASQDVSVLVGFIAAPDPELADSITKF